MNLQKNINQIISLVLCILFLVIYPILFITYQVTMTMRGIINNQLLSISMFFISYVFIFLAIALISAQSFLNTKYPLICLGGIGFFLADMISSLLALKAVFSNIRIGIIEFIVTDLLHFSGILIYLLSTVIFIICTYIVNKSKSSDKRLNLKLSMFTASIVHIIGSTFVVLSLFVCYIGYRNMGYLPDGRITGYFILGNLSYLPYLASIIFYPVYYYLSLNCIKIQAINTPNSSNNEV